MYSAPKFRAIVGPNAAAVSPVIVNGRAIPASASPVDDTFEATGSLCGSGWFRVCRVGTTAERPTTSAQEPSPAGISMLFLDTTLGYVIVFDGVAWRNPMTGAVV
jgi:hypothetical protein